MPDSHIRITIRHLEKANRPWDKDLFGAEPWDKDFCGAEAVKETYYFCANDLTGGRMCLHRVNGPARWIIAPNQPIIGEMWFLGYNFARFHYWGQSDVRKAEFAPIRWADEDDKTKKRFYAWREEVPTYVGYLQRQAGRPRTLSRKLKVYASSCMWRHKAGLVGISKPDVDVIEYEPAPPRPPLDLRKVIGLIASR